MSIASAELIGEGRETLKHLMERSTMRNDDITPLSDAIEAASRRGDYITSERIADAVAADAEGGQVALRRAQALQAVGRLQEASRIVRDCPRGGIAPETATLLDLEATRLSLLTDLAVKPALDSGRVRFTPLGKSRLHAEIEVLRCTLLLIAGIVGEVDAVEQATTITRMLKVGDKLADAGYPADALHVRLRAAVHPIRGQPVLRDPIIREAERLGEHAIAGRAWLDEAQHLMNADADPARIFDALTAAEAAFARADHRHGGIDAMRLRETQLAKNDSHDLSTLQSLIPIYQKLGVARGEFDTLSALADAARLRGLPELEDDCVTLMQGLSEKHGYRLQHVQSIMSRAHRLTEDGRFARARELCEQELAAGVPSGPAAILELMCSNALSAAGDRERALPRTRRAMVHATRANHSIVTEVTKKLVSDLGETRPAGWYKEAINAIRVGARHELAAGRTFLAIDLLTFMTYPYQIRARTGPPLTRRQLNQLADSIASAEAMLSQVETARQDQARIKVIWAYSHSLQVQDKPAESLRMLEAGLEFCDPRGLRRDAAEFRHMIGVFHFNASTNDLLGHFGPAEDALRGAVDYFKAAGSIIPAIRSREILARLYSRAAQRTTRELGERLRAAAVGELTASEHDIDIRCRDYSDPSPLATREGKRALTQLAQRVRETALIILLHGGHDAAHVFDWVQRGKSRQLNDLLGAGKPVPMDLRTRAAKAESTEQNLLAEEAALTDQSGTAEEADLPRLRERLDELHETMACSPALTSYQEIRTGMIDPGRARARFLGACGDDHVAFVDWFQVDDRFYIAVARGGEAPRLEWLGLSPATVRDFVLHELSPDHYAQTLARWPEKLRTLDGLITPLEYMTQPGDRLVLCPAGPLHAIPLHALELQGQPLLARNVVSYTAALGGTCQRL